MIARVLAVAGLLITAPVAAQQEVYKWVDAQGNVTYSETPPPGEGSSVSVDLLPGPAPADVNAAQQRAQAAQELGNQLGSERAQRASEMEQQRRAAGEAARERQAGEPPPDGVYGGGYGWWPYAPTYGPHYRPHYRPWPPPPPPPDNRNRSSGGLVPLPPRPRGWP
jgi:hypothetical protein